MGYYIFDFSAVNTSGLEFASAESYYQKIVGIANNYSHYASKCSGELWCFELQVVTDLC